MTTKKASPPPLPAKKGKPATAFRKAQKRFVPPKIVVVGVEGWGKTSLAANIDGVALIMPSTETGYLTLLGAGRVPAVDQIVTKSWRETLAAVDQAKGYKAIALDELSGFEKQCHEFVNENEYGGNWSKFWAYHRGLKIAAPEWMKLLSKLESLDVMVVALSHCSIETFQDPMSDDYDRYVAALAKPTWGVTRRWADACLFGTFQPVVDDDGKGIGGTDRVLYTEHRDAYDAKNRYGMEPEIDMPDDPAEMWGAVWEAITEPGGEEE